MELGKLGEQFVLKSEKAFEEIRFVSYLPVDNRIYYTKRKARDSEARASYFSAMEQEDAEGLYMRDLIREEVKADDARLR